MDSLQRAIEAFKEFVPPKGLSEEEKKEFKARVVRKYELINKERHKPYEFDFMSRFEEIEIKREELPDFMYGILKIECMLKTQAEIFIDEFCIPYLQDQEFKDQVFGKWILVEDGYFYIMNGSKKLDFDSNTNKTIVKIGPLETVNRDRRRFK